eukprot:COSAG02_NODE_53_length_44062_cov_22.860223_33_plen_197_part_00
MLGIRQTRAKVKERRPRVVLVSPARWLAHAEVVKVDLLDVVFVVHGDGQLAKQQWRLTKCHHGQSFSTTHTRIESLDYRRGSRHDRVDRNCATVNQNHGYRDRLCLARSEDLQCERLLYPQQLWSASVHYSPGSFSAIAIFYQILFGMAFVSKCLQAGQAGVHPVYCLMFLMIADANEQEYLVRSLCCRNGFRDAA